MAWERNYFISIRWLAMLCEEEQQRFRRQLIDWFAQQQRDLPWRRTQEPYAIWVSEIMLQQTRVAAVIPYYERFLARYPDLYALADSSEADLLSHWAGLGYYARAHNLQRAARLMRDVGGFPTTIEGIRGLPGVGDYTAAAIASISFGLPYAVLDGNVFRVLSRVFNDETNISSSVGRKHFAGLAEKLLDRDQPGTFNQALMELGATVCLPARSHCLACPVSELCAARLNGKEHERPVKRKRSYEIEEPRIVFWIEDEGNLLVWQRPPSSRLMAGFWELPEPNHLPDVASSRMLGYFRHTITSHKYLFEVRHAALAKAYAGDCRWIPLTDLDKHPMSTILRKARRKVDQFKGDQGVRVRGVLAFTGGA